MMAPTDEKVRAVFICAEGFVRVVTGGCQAAGGTINTSRKAMGGLPDHPTPSDPHTLRNESLKHIRVT